MKYHLLTILILVTAVVASGQEELRPGVRSQSWEVFVQRDAENPATTTVIFLDLLTGETSSVATVGERYTLIDGAVIYFDRNDAHVKLVKPDAIIRDHPYIVMNSGDYRVDWAVSGDGQRITWAVSRRDDDNLLTTSIKVADAAGADLREVLVYGPRLGIRLIPIAFDGDNETFYVEVHADGTSEATPYTRRTGLFALSFGAQNVSTNPLPGDQTCFCPVGFGKDLMLRLVTGNDSAGIEVEIHELRSGARRVVPPVSLGSYDEAGNILVSPDGKLAVYALSQITGFGTAQQQISSVVVLADLENARQIVLNSPMTALLRPISWTEDNTAVLVAQEWAGGTWKMQLDDGVSVKVADGRYLGRIGETAST